MGFNPTLGEISLVAFNYAPKGWAFCDGSLLAIRSNTALYSLLGTAYGGDGQTTFALPDLRGRTPVGFGAGPGLTDYPLGTPYGVENVTLNPTELPAHVHAVPASTAIASSASPVGAVPAVLGNEAAYGPPGQGALATDMTSAGGNQAHPNRPPYLGLNYVICLAGSFPQRT